MVICIKSNAIIRFDNKYVLQINQMGMHAQQSHQYMGGVSGMNNMGGMGGMNGMNAMNPVQMGSMGPMNGMNYGASRHHHVSIPN